MKKIFAFIIGVIFLLFGIYLSVFKREPHFYAFFSIGLFLILISIYKNIFKKQLFSKWNFKKHLIFWTFLIIISIIIDLIGLRIGYWAYQYNGFYDEILKYLFEWVIPFVYILLSLLIGISVFEKLKINRIISFILSLLIFVIIIGLFTEFINHFSNSWIILKMPITSYNLEGYFVVFQTIGYWLMALITFFVYKIVEKIK